MIYTAKLLKCWKLLAHNGEDNQQRRIKIMLLLEAFLMNKKLITTSKYELKYNYYVTEDG